MSWREEGRPPDGQEVCEAIGGAREELLMVTPYFVPSDGELALLKGLRERNVGVRILSNSLESAPELSAQSGYSKFRVPLLEAGVELYEVRALLERTRGSGQTRAVSRYGNFGLHAKLYVIDRRRLYIGSMNYDQRSFGSTPRSGSHRQPGSCRRDRAEIREHGESGGGLSG